MPAELSLTDGRLSDALRDQYWNDGYLFPIPVFSPEEAAEFRRELETLEKEWLDAGLPRALNQYKRVNAHCVIPLAARVATRPEVLDVVSGIIGPDVMIWGAEFFIKEPRTKHIVSMHQDLTYWGMGETDHQVTAWIALSPATPDSGCMDFDKGSHKNAILPHTDTFSENNLLSRGQEIAVDVAEEDKTAIEIHPGQMSLHHGQTIHGSGPNVSDDRRIALVVRYINPNVKQQVAKRDFAIMARGMDRQGNFHHIAPPQRNFEPHMLDIYEEIRTEQAAALAAGAENSVKMYSAT